MPIRSLRSSYSFLLLSLLVLVLCGCGNDKKPLDLVLQLELSTLLEGVALDDLVPEPGLDGPADRSHIEGLDGPCLPTAGLYISSLF